ncbi:hypothetical protein F5Y19DRAFT_478128 [Xylariaceae sp. FL1651]|nr:hypothetical protein F5Y19DRAFT_478128 [Xylariaceae sp. FL1651]
MQQAGPGGFSPLPNNYAYGAYPHPPPQQQDFGTVGYGNSAPAPQPPAPAPPGFPSALELLFIRDGRHNQIVKAAGRPDALLVLTLPWKDELGLCDGSNNLTARRGHSTAETIATARLHEMTTSKADMTLWGRHVRWKKEYESFTGLGQLCWQPSGDKGLILEANGRLLARYSTRSGKNGSKGLEEKLFGSTTVSKLLGSSGLPGSTHGQLNPGTMGGMGGDDQAEARLEIYASSLSREQLEEIVISCAVERERSEKSEKNKRDAEIVGEVFGAVGS